MIRLDNGLEVTAQVIRDGATSRDIKLIYIQPGKPTQNAIIERFNRSFRTAVLNQHLFRPLGSIICLGLATEL
jgi:putative transposase